MHKVFVLAAVIAVMPLPQHFYKGGFKDISHKPAFLFTLKNTNPVNPCESKKNNAVDTTALKQSNWYSEILKNIEASEYEIKKDGKTKLFTAPNHQQQLKSFFNYNGFTLQPRSEEKTWQLKMQLTGIYADKKLIATPAKKDLPSANANKIVFNSTNFSTEYINSKEGVRQNFIIQKKPTASCSKITVQLSINKGWHIDKVHDKELHFAKVENSLLSNKITYNGLKVWDADNKELVAKFVVNKKHTEFEIEVNALDAVYPFTIDPLSSSPATILNGNSPGNYFGNSVASAGDVNGDGYSDVIVGASGVSSNIGAAYLFLGSATGLSTSPSTTLSGNFNDLFFGCSVASAGDVNGDGYSDVIVGAFGTGTLNQGAAYLFTGSVSGLSTSPSATLIGIGGSDWFGSSVASAGDVNGDGYSDVIIGAYRVASLKGAAYLFLGSITGLSITPATTLNGINAGDQFGNSVASAGDINGDGYSDVIIGALGVSSFKGAAYLFLGSGTGLSITPATTLNGINTGNQFGNSVASAGDINGDGYSDVIVGAPEVSSAIGAVYLFLGSIIGLSALPSTTLNGISPGEFGHSVACAGDVNGDGYSDVIVGALSVSGKGAAYFFLGSSTGLSTSPSITLNDINNVSNDYYGRCVASAGDINGDGYSDIIVGADGVSSNTGAAYTYHGSSDGLQTISYWQTLEAQAGANYGISVASAGDVNGDGFSDVIVGAYIYDQGFGDNGKAYLYLGSATGLSTTAAWTAVGTMGAEYFGRCVAAAGDVNADGYGDVLVGAYGYTSGQSQEGRVYLYYGSAAGLSVTAAWTYENNVATSVLGVSAAAAGDVNGDGYSDIIIGGPQYQNGEANEGVVYLFYGTATIPAATPNWSAEGNQVGAFFGVSVANLGDVNGDGFSDVIVGASSYDNGFTDEGQAFAYYGSATGLPATPSWIAKGNQAGAQFGNSVSSAGDINGDGYADALVGALSYDDGTTDEGAAFVYYGSATGLSLTANWTAENNLPNTLFGYSVSCAGDVNGDGYSDVLVGARNYSNGQVNEGALYTYYGSSTGLSLTSSWFVEGNIAGTLLGNSVATAGDVNGDGFSDIIAGAPYYVDPNRNGAAFVYYGSNNTGLRNNLRLYNTDLTTPINSSNFSLGNFGAGLFAKSFLGRDNGKLVWETRLNYNAYSGIPITNSCFFTAQQGTYTNLGLTGTELKNSIAKIAGSGKYTKLRARVKYNLTTAITGQVYGPWRYVSPIIDGNLLGALPIELISFNAVWLQKGKTAQLNFTTDKEVGTCCFDIEKSMDGFSFTPIITITARNSSGVQSYSFIDNNAVNKDQFYRVKIKGNNGQVQYSNIQALQNNIATEILVFPNPVTDVLQLQLNNNYAKINVQIVNAAGQIVKQLNDLAVFNQTIRIPVSNLSSGNYWLRLQTGTEKQVLQFVKD